MNYEIDVVIIIIGRSSVIIYSSSFVYCHPFVLLIVF